MSEVTVTLGGERYTIPVQPPIKEVADYSQSEFASEFYVQEDGARVQPDAEVMAKLVSASQATWIMQVSRYWDPNSDLFSKMAQVRNLANNLEGSIEREEVVEASIKIGTGLALTAITGGAAAAAYAGTAAATTAAAYATGSGLIGVGLTAAEQTEEWETAQESVTILDTARGVVDQALAALQDYQAKFTDFAKAEHPEASLGELQEASNLIAQASQGAELRAGLLKRVAEKEGEPHIIDQVSDLFGAIPFHNVEKVVSGLSLAWGYYRLIQQVRT